VDRRSMLLASGGLALASLGSSAPASAAVSDAILAKAEEVKAALKRINTAGSTGPLPLDEDFIIAVIDDGSPLVQAAFIGAASTGAKAVKLKYDKKGGKAGRKKTQEEYQSQGCLAVITPTVDPLFELMQGAGLECETCSYGGGNAPPKYFIVMDSKGMTNKEMSGEAGVAGWGCFDETLAIVPGNIFKQKPGQGKIKTCGPYGIQVPVLALDTIPKLAIKEGDSLMSVEGVGFEVADLPTGK